MRQIPYTMMKFGAFERVVEGIYAYAMPKPKADCSKRSFVVLAGLQDL